MNALPALVMLGLLSVVTPPARASDSIIGNWASKPSREAAKQQDVKTKAQAPHSVKQIKAGKTTALEQAQGKERKALEKKRLADKQKKKHSKKRRAAPTLAVDFHYPNPWPPWKLRNSYA